MAKLFKLADYSIEQPTSFTQGALTSPKMSFDSVFNSVRDVLFALTGLRDSMEKIRDARGVPVLMGVRIDTVQVAAKV